VDLGAVARYGADAEALSETTGYGNATDIFRCSLDYAKRSFRRAANAIFREKNGRTASEDVLLQLLKLKCIPILLHALEVCQLPTRDLQSLDFIVSRFFR